MAELSLKNRVLTPAPLGGARGNGLLGKEPPGKRTIRRFPGEKREIIHLAEHSALSVGCTLDGLDMPRSTFCRWCRQYQQAGEQGLEPQPSKRRQLWNRLPEPVCDQIVGKAQAKPEESSQDRLLE